MKRFLALGLCLIMAIVTLTGCNSKQQDKPESNPTETASSDTATQASTVATPASDNNNDSDQNKAVAPTGPVDGLSSKYVDFDKRTFAINGKAYTLGVNTLQDMIDDGVPFDEGDLADANNNVKPNYESQGFSIELGEYYSAQVYVSNFSDDNAVLANCVLSQVYLPVDLDKEQDIIQFAFPLTITEEELIAQAGEPTENREYKSDDGKYITHYVNYLTDSDVYLGNSGYKFEFTNGALRYLYIDYLP